MVIVDQILEPLLISPSILRLRVNQESHRVNRLVREIRSAIIHSAAYDIGTGIPMNELCKFKCSDGLTFAIFSTDQKQDLFKSINPLF